MCNWVAWWYKAGPDHTESQVADQVAELALATVKRGHGRGIEDSGPAAAIALLREDLAYLEKTLEETGSN